VYNIDATGTKIVKDESYYKGEFRGFKVDKPREIWLDYTELAQPTLGGIFFIWYYKSYFTNIYVETKYYFSTASGEKGKNYMWIHGQKQQKGAKTK